jgi:hypothetical protein
MKENKICIIIPTKDRLSDFKLFADSYIKTSRGRSVVIVAVDEDDHNYDDYLKNFDFIVERMPPNLPLITLNMLANKYCKKYNYLCYFEDDMVFSSTDWEDRFINKLETLGKNGIVFGDDLVNHDYIVGTPFLNSSIVERLGYMCPPELTAVFCDHFWKQLGVHCNSLYYFPDIIIEHRHYITGKRSKDQISEKMDSRGPLDMLVYNTYMASKFAQDMHTLLNS